MSPGERLGVLGGIARQQIEVHLHPAGPISQRDDLGEHRVYVVTGHHDCTSGDPRRISSLVEEGLDEAGPVDLLDITGDVHLDASSHPLTSSDA